MSSIYEWLRVYHRNIRLILKQFVYFSDGLPCSGKMDGLQSERGCAFNVLREIIHENSFRWFDIQTI